MGKRERAAAMSFVGGKLRLKGDNDGGVSKKKKKKKKRRREKHQLLSHVAEDHEEEQEENTAGYVIKRKDGPVDRRTKAEKRFDEILTKREVEEVTKAASKTHRKGERIQREVGRHVRTLRHSKSRPGLG